MDLLPHPESLWSPWRVSADVSLEGNVLTLRFRINDELEALVIPPHAPAVHTDELWRTTCCEWFVADANGTGYAEFNFSPSGAWAAYRFDDYRRGMRADALAGGPSIAVAIADGALMLEATLPWTRSDPARFGCSAVLQHLDGRKAYHALAHAPGGPDFHAAACFVGQLGGTSAP
jgi:hypothetical protein